MKEQLDRIEQKVNDLIEKNEHRLTSLEVNVTWLRRSFYGLLSFLTGITVYILRPFF